MFEGFTKASVWAIEAHDPITAGHSFRVADFNERTARARLGCAPPRRAGDPATVAHYEEKALDILAAEAKASRIDASLYRVFVESGAWRLKH